MGEEKSKQVVNNSGYITGLKGVAAVMIVIFHLQFIYSSPLDFVYKVLAFNSTWVNMFFVISAYTITKSIITKKIFTYTQYLQNRYLRIAPAYYFMILLAFVSLPFFTPTFHWREALYRLLPHAFFLNTSPIDQKYQLLFLGTEWYVPVQFWLYVLAPVLIWIFRKNILVYVFVVFISFYLHFHKDALFYYEEYFDFASSIQNFLWVYVLGIGVQLLREKPWARPSVLHILGGVGLVVSYGYFVIQLTTSSERLYAFLLLGLFVYVMWWKNSITSIFKNLPRVFRTILAHLDIMILLVLLFKYILNWYFIKHPHEFMALWSIVFLVASSYRPLLVRVFFENRVVMWLGNLSYGIYLTHFFILTMVGYIVPGFGPIARTVIIIPATLLLAYFLHTYVENKFVLKSPRQS